MRLVCIAHQLFFIPEEDEITCHQPPRLASRTGSELEFLTPVSYITGIQNLNNSTSKVSIDQNLSVYYKHYSLVQLFMGESV